VPKQSFDDDKTQLGRRHAPARDGRLPAVARRRWRGAGLGLRRVARRRDPLPALRRPVARVAVEGHQLRRRLQRGVQRLDDAQQLLRSHEPAGEDVTLAALERELAQRREHAGSRAGVRVADVERQRGARRQQQAHVELDSAKLDPVQPRPRPPLGLGGGGAAAIAAGLGGAAIAAGLGGGRPQRLYVRLQRLHAARQLAHGGLRCVEYPLVLAPPAARHAAHMP